MMLVLVTGAWAHDDDDCCPGVPAEAIEDALAATAADASAEQLAGQRFMLLVIVDGGQADAMRELIAEGKLPNIKKHLVDRGLSCFDGVTVWPSTSVPAHTSIVTGRFPAGHGVLFPKWLDRRTRHYRDYISLQIGRLGRDMRAGAVTLYERLPERSIAALEICHRGASLFLAGTPRDGITERITVALASMFQWSGNVASAFLKLSHINPEARARNSLPRLMVLNFAEVDHQTHIRGVDLAVSGPVYSEMDRHFGNVVAMLQKLGIYENTVIGLTADHGMGPAREHIPLHQLMSDLGLNVLPPSRMVGLALAGSMFDRIPGLHVDDHDVIAMWGGTSEMAIHLRGIVPTMDARVVRSWDLRPYAEGLRSYPVGEPGKRVDFVQWLLDQHGVELVVTRAAGGEILVHGAKGVAQIDATGGATAGSRLYGYRTVSGEDPLGYAADPALARAGLANGQQGTAEQWLAATARHAYPDAPVRLANVFGDERDADLYVIAQPGFDFIPPEMLKLKTVAGTHGHLNHQQSAVPFLLAGPNVPHATLPYARNVDMVPTLLEAYGVPYDRTTLDGVSRLPPAHP